MRNLAAHHASPLPSLILPNPLIPSAISPSSSRLWGRLNANESVDASNVPFVNLPSPMLLLIRLHHHSHPSAPQEPRQNAALPRSGLCSLLAPIHQPPLSHLLPLLLPLLHVMPKLIVPRSRLLSALPPGHAREYHHVDAAIMTAAVAFYDKKKRQGDPWAKSAVAKKFGIPRRSFANYANDDLSKRFKIGSKVGRPSLVSEEDHEFLVELIIRADRANEGLTSREIIHILVSLTAETDNPLSVNQAETYVYHTLHHDEHLKSKLVRPQKTTGKRSMTSVAHQWRWHKNVSDALDFLRKHNTGLCNLTGKTFGELIDYFVIGADEACLMADAHGNLRIVGAADKKKHERKTGEVRCSITIYRSGVSNGGNGPTGFLMKGKKKRPGFTDQFLVRNGCEPGSTVIMTDNAFMTNEAWVQLTKKVSCNILMNSPFIFCKCLIDRMIHCRLCWGTEPYP